MNPAYPGGFEILAAGRPNYVILQHAPRRLEYDGFPGYKLHPLNEQIAAIEVISGKKVLAVTLNHELMGKEEILKEIKAVEQECGLPTFDVLEYGASELISLIKGDIEYNGEDQESCHNRDRYLGHADCYSGHLL